MKSLREIDELVAQRIFGYVPCEAKSHKDGSAPWPCFAHPESPTQGGELKAYSSNIEEAFSVVQALDATDFTLEKSGRNWTATFSISEATDIDPALAICRAALTMRGIET